MFEDFDAKLADARRRIAAACARVGRDADQVTLLAVTKGHPFDAMRVARAHGLIDLGENRIQDALPKLDRIDEGARVHLIGRLQTNKVNKAVGAFASIMGVDREDLLSKIASRAASLELVQDIWIQVNSSGEEQKGGVEPGAAPALWRQAIEAAGVRPIGLMTMARFGAEEEELRASFAQLRGLARDLESAQSSAPIGLSMGMSGDFEIAVEEGSTCVRLGTTLFGPRPSAPVT